MELPWLIYDTETQAAALWNHLHWLDISFHPCESDIISNEWTSKSIVLDLNNLAQVQSKYRFLSHSDWCLETDHCVMDTSAVLVIMDFFLSDLQYRKENMELASPYQQTRNGSFFFQNFEGGKTSVFNGTSSETYQWIQLKRHYTVCQLKGKRKHIISIAQPTAPSERTTGWIMKRSTLWHT